MRDLKIVFMGTPEFAVPSLNILIENNCNVVACITAVDKPKGRGQKLAISPVKQFCIKHKIPVLQPTNLKNPEFVETLKAYGANLQVVVAFRMLPEVVWNMPVYGTFNLHASMLPDYRGAAPINWAIINGESKTGVTTFFLDKEIDTGQIILQEEENIMPDDDAGSLYERLKIRGAQLVLKTVKLIDAGQHIAHPQKPDENLHAAPKIFKEDCQITWHLPAKKIHDFVRGLSPFPTAWTEVNGKICKIYKTAIVENHTGLDTPGNFMVEDNKALYFKSNDDLVQILELQMEGKKRMNVIDFLRGNKL